MSGKITEPAVKIDRLILDIPGFDPAEAGALARQIGEYLAASGAASNRKSLALSIPAGGENLAARIAAALLERLR